MRLPLLGCLCGAWGVFSFTLVTFFSHRAHGGHGGFKRTVSSPQDSGPSPNPFPAGRGVVCEVTPTGLLAYFVEVFALTELTELTEPFWHTFRSHRRPSAYREHRAF